MKILHIDEQRRWGGGEQQVAYLLRGLVERGHEVLAIGRMGSAFSERVRSDFGERLVTLPLRGEWDVASARRIGRLARSEMVDIIHAHTGHAHSLACMARRWAGSAKVVVTRRMSVAPKSSVFNRYKYSLPDRYVCISNSVRDVLGDLGVRSDRMSVVYSAIDPKRLDVEAMSREELGVDSDAFLIGCVGSLVHAKDQRTLIDAMPLVLKQAPEAHLVIAGEGPLRGELETRIGELSLGGQVTLLGHCDRVPGLLRALDVFAMPSREEGLGTSVLDAMAAGVPVVSTDAGGLPEMVKHEDTGLRSAVGDAEALATNLLRVAQDRDLAARLVGNARALVEARFTVDRMVEGNIAVYAGLLGSS